jgi:hypothetical protein
MNTVNNIYHVKMILSDQTFCVIEWFSFILNNDHQHRFTSILWVGNIVEKNQKNIQSKIKVVNFVILCWSVYIFCFHFKRLIFLKVWYLYLEFKSEKTGLQFSQEIHIHKYFYSCYKNCIWMTSIEYIFLCSERYFEFRLFLENYHHQSCLKRAIWL